MSWESGTAERLNILYLEFWRGSVQVFFRVYNFGKIKRPII